MGYTRILVHGVMWLITLESKKYIQGWDEIQHHRCTTSVTDRGHNTKRVLSVVGDLQLKRGQSGVLSRCRSFYIRRYRYHHVKDDVWMWSASITT